MRFLLDTQVAIWALFDDPRLSREAREILDDPESSLQFSVCSIWEIAIKRGLNRPDFQYDPRLIRRTLLKYGCEELAIQSTHAFEVESLPLLRKDPFDRLLIAQAIYALVTTLVIQNVTRFVLTYGPAVCKAVKYLSWVKTGAGVFQISVPQILGGLLDAIKQYCSSIF